ncbi:MAG: histone deacetylase [Spirochaetia bacterium]|jgi:acetoin utilization deacetylase AcuC-like enzyme|nr:histone deacetylase [Spirochaetia bacterium]
MKTVLFDESGIINLKMFGIEIPSLKSRKTNTLEALLGDSELNESKDTWLVVTNPYSIKREDLERIHTAEYVEKLYSEKVDVCIKNAFELEKPDGTFNRYNPEQMEAPLSELFNQVLKMSSGTYYAAIKALETGFCYYMGGGMHHGHKDFGHGFCPTNDIMLSASRIISEKKANSIWIIDVDAHKGDGTAEIAGDFDSIRTLSIHMAQGWPLDEPEYDSTGKFNPAYFPSDIDINIKSGEENTYNARLVKGMKQLENLNGIQERPDLGIVLLGADPYEKDELPSTDSLNLTEAQMLERDKIVYNFLNDRNIPAAYTMAGGYGSYSWEAHYNFLNWVLKKK